MHDELPQQHRNHGFLIALTIVGAVAIGFSLFIRNEIQVRPRPASPQVGYLFPAIEAEGWINGNQPSVEDLQGHVIVVDAWAYWCGPCRQTTPFLIEIYEKFKDRGVIFIGLTSEGHDTKSIEASRQYVKSLKIPWLNGYAANKTLMALDVHGIPQVWVVDGQNRIIFQEEGWVESSPRDIEQAVAKALDAK